MVDHSRGRGWPKILKRKNIQISPWLEVTEREVEFARGASPETYHSLNSPDYVIVIALTPQRRVPLVRQYRPSLETFTLELPSGVIDPGEDPAATAARELLEETGYPAETVRSLGVAPSNPGRMNSRAHSFFVNTGDRMDGFQAELGVETLLVTPSELVRLIAEGSLGAQNHLGTLLLAGLNGCFPWEQLLAKSAHE